MSTISASTTSTTAYKVAADTTGTLVLQTGATPTTAVTIDTSQNVGIGTTPSAWGSSYKALQFNSGSLFSSTGGTAMYLMQNGYYNGTNWIGSSTAPATIYTQNAGVHVFYSDSVTSGASFTPTERARIDSSGNLLVGTASQIFANTRFTAYSGTNSYPVAALVSGVTGDVSNTGLFISKFDNNSTTSQVFARFTINNAGIGSGQINANGASQAAFGSYSDERLKENIIALEPQLAKIMALRPVEFDYKAGGHQTGFIAQEMQQVFPDAVGEDGSEEHYLTVTGWNKTEAILVKAIQELNAKVDAQAAEIAALKGAA